MNNPENLVSYAIRGAAFKVYNNLGAGLLESLYQTALAHELEKEGHIVRVQVAVPVIYDGIKIEQGFRLDMLVDGLVIVEIKSVDELHPVHYKQLTTYLKLTGLKLGLLINFNTADLNESIKRIANKL